MATTTPAKDRSVTVPDSWSTVEIPLETAHRLVIEWKDGGPDSRTVTNLEDGDTAQGVFNTLSHAAEVHEVLWQTRGKTGRPRFRAVTAVIYTTLPV